MSKISFILFDCMETLIDLTELPSITEYALWAFKDSGVEHIWNDFNEFLDDYKRSREIFKNRLPEYMEYEMYERFMFIVKEKLEGTDENKIHETAKHLYDNYWRNYKSKSYVRDDVEIVLHSLSKKYRLGVVSNFMVQDGIEELLSLNRLVKHFDFIVTSIKDRWRKPHSHIYESAVERTQTSLENILFVGDDYLNDYIGPKNMGMKAVLLDRYNKYPDLENRIADFYGLNKLLNIY